MSLRAAGPVSCNKHLLNITKTPAFNNEFISFETFVKKQTVESAFIVTVVLPASFLRHRYCVIKVPPSNLSVLSPIV